MKNLSISLSLLCIFSISAIASDDHNLRETCKSECPSAKTEDEAHVCMTGVVAKKKGDKKFRKSDCYEAFKEHEKHDSEKGHKH